MGDDKSKLDPFFLSCDALIMDSEGWLPRGAAQEKLETKCECGAIVTYGEKCPPEYHSHWCPLSKDK